MLYMCGPLSIYPHEPETPMFGAIATSKSSYKGKNHGHPFELPQHVFCTFAGLLILLVGHLKVFTVTKGMNSVSAVSGNLLNNYSYRPHAGPSSHDRFSDSNAKDYV